MIKQVKIKVDSDNMIEGKLLERVKRNVKRVMDDIYDYPNVFRNTSDWPGDFPGRTLLALTSLYLVFKEDSPERQRIKERLNVYFSHIKEYLNENFFFGHLFDEQKINEQQMSGNSWFIRGLCRYYQITKEEKIITWLKSISKNYLLPLSHCYSLYPIKERKPDGGVAGHILESKDKRWLLSSDIGCAFILLDGYVSAYEILQDKELEEAIKEIIYKYKQIDFVNLNCQTHATLTCARAILRFYQITQDKQYLELAKHIFDIYQSQGMTDDYQNVNWFLKNESWTEPCCVVDSFILAKHLYLITKENKYLVLFNRIYLNGLRTFQRDNGGAGCTSVAKDGARELKVIMYEAFFCCSLREGEGMYELATSIFRTGDKYLFMLPESFEDDTIKADIDLYEDKVMRIKFKKPAIISIYVPHGFKSDLPQNDNLITINSNGGNTVDIPFELEIQKVGYRYMCGDMLLSQKGKHIDKTYLLDNKQYSYIYNSSLFSEEELSQLVQTL